MNEAIKAAPRTVHQLRVNVSKAVFTAIHEVQHREQQRFIGKKDCNRADALEALVEDYRRLQKMEADLMSKK